MTKGMLNDREPHPAAMDALDFIRSHTVAELAKWNESFASCAIEGNRTGEICGGTLNRLISGDKVSDRYLLGLAWTMMRGKR